ncbi:MAG: metallophosphoesterase [Bacteroidetes bacterium]|nr:metallophosphoesterase [Fibrella sp.]
MASSRRSFLKSTISSAAVLTPSATLWPALADKQPDSSRVFRFAVASDGHYGQPNTDFIRYFSQVIESLNAEKERSGLDACFFNGDLIHDDVPFMPQAKAYFDQLKMPYYVTRGNHDMVSPVVWQQTWGYPEDHVVDLGPCAFVLGNTSNEKGEYVCADHRWLGSALDKLRKKQHVFILLHIPQRKWTKNGIDCPQVMETIERYANVKAIFHGHDHDEDAVRLSASKPYLSDGHFGGSWGTAYHGYRIVEVFADGRVTTYQFNPEVNPVINMRTLG